MLAILLLSGLIAKFYMKASGGFIGANENIALDFVISAITQSQFLLISGIFISIIVCDDFEQQTIKSIISKGYSRTKVYYSKLFIVWFAETIMFLLVVIASILIGGILFKFDGIFKGQLFTCMLSQYIAVLANIILYFALSSTIKKTGSSIAAVIFVPQIIDLLLRLADTFIKNKKIMFSEYWLSSFTQQLASLEVESKVLITCLVGSLIYILVFIALGHLLNKKYEI